MPGKRETNPDLKRRNGLMAIACAVFFVSMIGVAYAAVPLYQLFCQVTGYGGTTQRAEQYSDEVLDRKINIRFDANTAPGLGWEFGPGQRQVTIRIGETARIFYGARNKLRTASSGRATFNVTPQAAGAYFNKVECFCFTDTTLEPGQELTMPVVFFVDPDIVNSEELKNVRTITLSYTFFPQEPESPVAAGSGKQPKSRTVGG